MTTPDPDDPIRLARLADIASIGGEAAVAGFLQRFGDQLQSLRATPDWSSAGAHKIVGLAGILGFGAIEQAWSAIEYAEWPPSEELRATALAALEEALAFIQTRRS